MKSLAELKAEGGYPCRYDESLTLFNNIRRDLSLLNTEQVIIELSDEGLCRLLSEHRIWYREGDLYFDETNVKIERKENLKKLYRIRRPNG